MLTMSGEALGINKDLKNKDPISILRKVCDLSRLFVILFREINLYCLQSCQTLVLSKVTINFAGFAFILESVLDKKHYICLFY